MTLQDGQVYAAFDILLEELESMANAAHKNLERLLMEREYDALREGLEVVTRIEEFREKVRMLREEWAAQFPKEVQREDAERQRKSRLARGLRTPEKEFERPILEALIELGGSARIADVMEQVRLKMQNILNEHDYETLPSDPNLPRWRNTAQWARLTLVKKGYMKADSPTGLWEITEKGKEWLKS